MASYKRVVVGLGIAGGLTVYNIWQGLSQDGSINIKTSKLREEKCTAYLWSLFELNRDAFLPSWGGGAYAEDWWPIIAKTYPSLSHAFDVGANEGKYALGLLGALPPSTDIHMFEGNPAHQSHLAELVRQHNRLRVAPAAVSDRVGMVQFWGVGTGGRIEEEVADPEEQRKREQALRDLGLPLQGRVKLTTLSHVVLDGGEGSSNDLSIPLKTVRGLVVKTDTEGNDLNVLRGLRELLKTKTLSAGDGQASPIVKLVQAEYNPRQYCRNRYESQGSFQYFKCTNNQRFWRQEDNLLLQMTALLRDVGYSTFLVGPVFLPLTPVLDGLEHSENMDWLPYLHTGTSDIIAVPLDDAHSATVVESLASCSSSRSQVPERTGKWKTLGMPYYELALQGLHRVFGLGDVFLYPFGPNDLKGGWR